jgi:hypothetical protein
MTQELETLRAQLQAMLTELGSSEAFVTTDKLLDRVVAMLDQSSSRSRRRGEMGLSADQMPNVERSLRHHRALLAKLLKDPDRDAHDHHLAIAVHLRVLLCDTTYIPILIDYAKAKGILLRVWGPNPAGAKPHKGAVFSINFLVAAWDRAGGYHLPIEEYLKAPLGATPIRKKEFETNPDAPGAYGLTYTPCQLIKWTANKEGAAHYDPEKPATFESFKNSYVVTKVPSDGTEPDAFLLRDAMYQLADWAIHAIDYVLGQGPAPIDQTTLPVPSP